MRLEVDPGLTSGAIARSLSLSLRKAGVVLSPLEITGALVHLAIAVLEEDEQDGAVSGWADGDIAAIMQIEGNPKKIFAALVSSGFVVKEEGHLLFPYVRERCVAIGRRKRKEANAKYNESRGLKRKKRKKAEPKEKPVSKIDSQVQEVVDYYQTQNPKRGRHLVKSHRDWSVIQARIGDGFSPEELKQAIDGNLICDWHRERNMHGVLYVFRNAEKVARFIQMAESGRGSPQKMSATEKETREFIEATLNNEGLI